jgi:hypothetical protein
LVDAVSPNASAAPRALLLLGASAAGYDLVACRADLGRLLGKQLDPPVRAAIDALYDAGRTHVDMPSPAWPTSGPHSTYERATAGPQAGDAGDTSVGQGREVPPDDDPFASVGMDV